MASYSLRPHDSNTSYSILHSDIELNTQSLKRKTLITRNTRITKNHSPASRPLSTQKKQVESHLRLPKTPHFSPLHHPIPLHRAYNTLPEYLLSKNVIGSRHIMDLFLPLGFLTLLVENTNSYAAQKRSENAADRVGDGKARSWSLVSVP